jgi:DNA polymerase III epsilon subunit-like protein
MIHVVCDFETTGVNTLDAEIITGHFIVFDEKLKKIQEMSIKSCPFKWSETAEMVHGISYDEARNWPKFEDIFEDIWDFFEANKPDNFWCHAKTDMFGKEVYFDYAILRYQMFLMGDLPYHVINRVKPYSTLSLAKVTNRFIGFDSFNLASVCSMLGIPLQHHNAKSDCEASFEIIKKLLPLTSLEEIRNYEQGVINENSPRVSKRNREQSRASTSSFGFF